MDPHLFIIHEDDQDSILLPVDLIAVRAVIEGLWVNAIRHKGNLRCGHRVSGYDLAFFGSICWKG